MADYIKREDALKMRFTDGIERDCIVYVPLKDVISHLKSIHAADVRENVKAHWIVDDGHYKCSNCRTSWYMDLSDDNFCANCGADMCGGEKDG